MKGVRITVEDLETGETESTVLDDDNYVLITAGACRRTSVQAYPKSGTHVITIKGVRGRST